MLAVSSFGCGRRMSVCRHVHMYVDVHVEIVQHAHVSRCAGTNTLVLVCEQAGSVNAFIIIK
jgi:hypothetical protein